MAKQINIKPLREKVTKHAADIKRIKTNLKPKSPRPSIQLGKHEILLRKAKVKPNHTSKTVLTDSTWNYVDIFLKQKKADEAQFYWEQCKNFYEATLSLSPASKPLTIYYCFLNAVKTLLTYKRYSFNLKHGVSGKQKDGQVKLQNEIISIKPRGVLSGLCNYLGEPVKLNEEHTLKDIMYNMPFVHRAFQLTFDTPTTYGELYIPMINPRFVYDKHRKKGWFEAQLEQQHSSARTLSVLKGFSVDRKYNNTDFYTIRRNKTFIWDCKRNQPTLRSQESFDKYYINIRNRLRYIYGNTELWYIKRADLTNSIIDRSTVCLIYAAMHRLSELARYQPQMLKKHLESNHSWLLSEFINKSPLQFIDNISSEITGDDFRVTGFRA